MKTEILYVELKQGHSGPAWIGYGHFSKSGRAVYFDGEVLRKGQGTSGNHFYIKPMKSIGYQCEEKWREQT